jgi:RNase P/RNase MRP subunit POP5
MVRQKSRWLLVRFDFESDILSSCGPIGDVGHRDAISKKRKFQSSSSNLDDTPSNSIHQVTSTDIYRSLLETITQNFGLVGAATTDVKVRLYDSKVRIAIIKTTRDKYPIVRSSLTVMTHIKQGGDVLKVVASTIAVSGSARTARNAAWVEIQKRFYDSSAEYVSKKKGGDTWSKRNRIAMEKGLQDLEERLNKIDSAC